MFLFVFSLSVSAIHLSFKENDSVVLEKELVQCAVFENNWIDLQDLKGNPVILCLFFVGMCVPWLFLNNLVI